MDTLNTLEEALVLIEDPTRREEALQHSGNTASPCWSAKPSCGLSTRARSPWSSSRGGSRASPPKLPFAISGWCRVNREGAFSRPTKVESDEVTLVIGAFALK